MNEGERGVKNPPNLVNVVYGCPLTKNLAKGVIHKPRGQLRGEGGKPNDHFIT